MAEQGDRVRAAQYLGWAQKDGVPAREIVPRLLALYTDDGQYRLAIDTAESYLRRHPSDARIRKCLGALYLAIDALDDARRSFEALVRDTPDDPDAHYALAATLRAAGTQHARADEQFRAYLALAPSGEHAEEVRASMLKELP
jgi:tetratricopeptide (TPR) repeat protein